MMPLVEGDWRVFGGKLERSVGAGEQALGLSRRGGRGRAGAEGGTPRGLLIPDGAWAV